MDVRKFTSGIGALLVASCHPSAPSASVLAPLDTQLYAGVFNQDDLVDDLSFQDSSTITSAEVQAFLEATPYGGASFLSTYSSHGVAAADAVVSAATTYGLNPLLFLVRAEADQGLVSATTYPSDANRVEFAFGCGCSGPGACDTSWSGFDRQTMCLASSFQAWLGDIALKGETPGGWGPGDTEETLDGVAVTPNDRSTAAIYQYDPVCGATTQRGAWLFWNVWERYTVAIGYGGPIPPEDAGLGPDDASPPSDGAP